MDDIPSKEPHAIRIRVQSTRSATVTGVGVLLGLFPLWYAFSAVDAGNPRVGSISVGLFLALVMGVGVIARRLTDTVEISNTGIRRGGLSITWHERPKVRLEKTMIQWAQLTMVRATVMTPTSAISFKLFKLPIIGTGDRERKRALEFVELIVSQGGAPKDAPR